MRIKLKCDQSKLRQSFLFKKNTQISLQDCTDNVKDKVFENNTQIINPAVSSVEILTKMHKRQRCLFEKNTQMINAPVSAGLSVTGKIVNTCQAPL